ncbi:hypothetical protein BDE36_4384 [Arcticibacter tournemirensis]|uniref:DUF4292 domain-containing protein n=1 Tax=Arcticibacter tournemirensis TaxID=699437 RepID=A0A5M9H9U3_9SPHI|nr:hypothetical protein [Arcticibacter tournemirensis]KAA8482591.1 hypothetical protein F1649_11480 [Arcticibacter tournemirensis]TQM52563.1 hypothetical protein BDE36_4384 [Arcticibacter tournemirensis]
MRKLNIKSICYCFCAIIFITAGCSNGSASSGGPEKDSVVTIDSQAVSQETAVTLKDSLKNLAKKDFELVELSTKGDTLNIVSTSAFLYYPLGKFRSIDDFSKTFKNLNVTTEHDVTDSSIVLNRASGDGCFIKLFKDSEKNALEIVSGRIINDQVKLVNGIGTGMNKVDFLKIFFKDVPPNEIEKVKVIKLISGLEGISHVYVFSPDRLILLYFDTDYSFNKD